MSEDISKFLLSQSIARTCLALGYQETSNAVIQSLTDIIQHYIEFIGERSVEQAEQSGRCHPGIQDILQALGSIVRIYILLYFICSTVSF